jgi:hypothetical protein
MKISFKAYLLGVVGVIAALAAIVVGAAMQVAVVQGFLDSGTPESNPAQELFVQDQHTACGRLDESPTRSTVADIFHDGIGLGMDSIYVQQVLGAAITDVCPQHFDLVYPFSQGES